MEQGLGSDSVPPSGSIDKSRVLNVRPLRCLVPRFPSSPGMGSVSNPQATPFVCVPPTGPFPPGVAPLYPFSASNGSHGHQNTTGAQNHPGPYGFGNTTLPSPVPLNAFRTPQAPLANGNAGRARKGNRNRAAQGIVIEDDQNGGWRE